jgi:integrase
MGVYKKEKNWFIDYRYQGKRIREKVGPSKRLAEKALAARRGEIAQGKFSLEAVSPTPLFEVFSDAYLEYSRANKRSHERDRYSILRLSKHFAGMRLSQITPWLIEKYKVQRRSEVKPATVNRELACLKHMFSMAIQWGRVKENPVKKVKLFREDNQNLRYLSLEEIQLLVDASSERLRPIILTALNTGMRKAEILNLEWDHIDFGRRAITVVDSKNSEGRTIPMNDALTHTLNAVRLQSKSQYVFGYSGGGPYSNADSAFQKAIQKAGIKKCRFHDLRHTFASHLVMSGVDLVTVKELLGHRTIKMTMRYSHLSQDHKRNAVERLSGHFLDTGAHSTVVREAASH